MTAPRPEIELSTDIARRYLLGRQGLWPGRHWRGEAGTLKAISALQGVQMDPVTIVARSHDLVLFDRVEGYRPDHLQTILSTSRGAFDYGGLLAVLPMDELPYWQLHMMRRRADARYTDLLAATGPLVDTVRTLVAQHGPISAKGLTRLVREMQPDSSASSLTRNSGSYRSSSVVSQLAYHLWLTGEFMTHHREGFERHVDLAQRVVPKALLSGASVADTERFFALKALARTGLATPSVWRGTVSHYLHQPVSTSEGRDWLERLVGSGDAVPVAVKGQRNTHYVPADGLSQIRSLVRGSTPRGWTPKGPTTDDQVRLLSPLDPIVAGGRAGKIFGFEHIWEIYKPEAKRRYGPFTMPLLYGDELVGRVDPRMDRKTGTMHLNGIWIEQDGLTDDPAFRGALSRGLRSFACFHDASSIVVHGAVHDIDASRLDLSLEP